MKPKKKETTRETIRRELKEELKMDKLIKPKKKDNDETHKAMNQFARAYIEQSIALERKRVCEIIDSRTTNCCYCDSCKLLRELLAQINEAQEK